jgi:hypothetical protein
VSLLLHIPNLIFGQHDSPSHRGWYIANLFHHNGKTVAVLSEKFTANGEYDLGPHNEYPYSLTNGIENAATAFTHYIIQTTTIPLTLRQPPEILIHFTPARNRPDRHDNPIYDAEYALLTLDWQGEHYLERSHVHPWTSITRETVEAYTGTPVDQIPLH